VSGTAFGIVLSVLSFVVSALTFWLNWGRRGRLAMTRPNIVFFGFDTTPLPRAKVFLRTLLYSTAAQGQVVEAMYVNLRDARGLRRTFSFWGYDEGSKLVPGSGLYASRAGVAANHHFVQSTDDLPLTFNAGVFDLEIVARVVGRRAPLRLSTVCVDLSIANAHALSKGEGVLFELSPEDGEYRGHVSGDRPLTMPNSYG
jgi:hypothetical protein